MSTAAEAKEKRPRKPRARHKDVVIAAMEERLGCVVQDDANSVHIARLYELVNELKRAVNSKPEDEEA